MTKSVESVQAGVDNIGETNELLHPHFFSYQSKIHKSIVFA